MTGRRVRPQADGTYNYADFQPGDYFFGLGQWWGVTPNGMHCGLKNHAVEEHPDGTITVTPSIMVNNGGEKTWHGFLKRGIWESC